jgi:hypothetical protein
METSISLVIAIGSVLLVLGVVALVGYRIADHLDKKLNTEIKHH